LSADIWPNGGRSRVGRPTSGRTAAVHARVEAATQAQVAVWAKRILTATSIDELFPD
jgi:hypothetical protein